MDDLALQVGVVDDVCVDDPERADAGRGEVERRGRAEPAGADQERAGREQPLLARLADLRDQQVAGVAAPLVRRERLRCLDLEAVPLPVGEPAGERRDVLVAELAERLRCEGRARAAGAVEDDLRGAVGDEPFDPRLELTTGDMERAGHGAFLPFLALAHVDEERRAVAFQRRGGADLVDLALHLGEQLSIGRHLCRKRYVRRSSSRTK